MLIQFLTIPHSLELFLWMLGSFLIGYLFAMFFYKKDEITETYNNSNNFSPTTQNIDFEPQELVIRARKTVERGGIEIKEPKKLNFKSIGKATEDEKDDLSKIKGVGPAIEKKLNSIGLFTYKQIANLTDKDMDVVTDLIQFFPGRIKRDNWKEQAKNLLSIQK